MIVNNMKCENCKWYKNKSCGYWFWKKLWKDNCDKILGYPKYLGSRIFKDQEHNCKDFLI